MTAIHILPCIDGTDLAEARRDAWVESPGGLRVARCQLSRTIRRSMPCLSPVPQP